MKATAVSCLLSLAALSSLWAAEEPAGAVTGRDLKAIRYVENAHGQLEEFTDRLLARLARGLGPREAEPILDGRAELQTAKIRVTYAGYVKNDELAALFGELAAAHAARLEALETFLIDTDPIVLTDESLYLDLDARVDELIERVRNWRTSR